MYAFRVYAGTKQTKQIKQSGYSMEIFLSQPSFLLWTIDYLSYLRAGNRLPVYQSVFPSAPPTAVKEHSASITKVKVSSKWKGNNYLTKWLIPGGWFYDWNKNNMGE